MTRTIPYAFFLLLLATPCFAQETPPFTEPVADYTGTLTSEERQKLTSKLEALHQSGKASMAVLVISSLYNEVLESFSLRVAETWALGDEKRDNGVLLLIVVNDRKMRLEVGSGLEGDIPDAYARRILDNDVRPWFKIGSYYNGIDTAIMRVSSYLDAGLSGQINPPPTGFARFKSRINMKAFQIICLLFAIPFLLSFVLVELGRRRGLSYHLRHAKNEKRRTEYRAKLSLFVTFGILVKHIFFYTFFSGFLGIFFYVGIAESAWVFLIVPSIFYFILYLFPLGMAVRQLLRPASEYKEIGSGSNSFKRSSSFFSSSSSGSSSFSSSSSSFSGGGGFSGGGSSSSW